MRKAQRLPCCSAGEVRARLPHPLTVHYDGGMHGRRQHSWLQKSHAQWPARHRTLDLQG